MPIIIVKDNENNCSKRNTKKNQDGNKQRGDASYGKKGES